MESKIKERVNHVLDKVDCERIDSYLDNAGVNPTSIDGFTAFLMLALACMFERRDTI